MFRVTQGHCDGSPSRPRALDEPFPEEKGAIPSVQENMNVGEGCLLGWAETTLYLLPTSQFLIALGAVLAFVCFYIGKIF